MAEENIALTGKVIDSNGVLVLQTNNDHDLILVRNSRGTTGRQTITLGSGGLTIPAVASLTVTGDATIGGTLAVTGVQTNAADLVLSAAAGIIRTNTADATDNKSLTLVGGGSTGNSRGGYVKVWGNESVGAGAVEIVGGAISGGSLIYSLSHASANHFFRNSSGGTQWALNDLGQLTQNSTGGGSIVMTKANTAVAQGVENNMGAAGATLATATPLTKVVNVVTSVAASQGVRLWDAPEGAVIYVCNRGAQVLRVYPTAATDTIYGAGGAGLGADVAIGGIVASFLRVTTGASGYWVSTESPIAP